MLRNDREMKICLYYGERTLLQRPRLAKAAQTGR